MSKPIILFRLASGCQQSVPLTNIPSMVDRAVMANGRRATSIAVHPAILLTMRRAVGADPELRAPDGSFVVAGLPVTGEPCIPLVCLAVVSKGDSVLFSLLDGQRIDPVGAYERQHRSGAVMSPGTIFREGDR